MNNNLAMGNMLGQLGSVVASVMFIWAIIQQYFPYNIRNLIEKYSQRFLTLFYPYIQITFNEFTGERFKRSEAYSAIETYLSKTSSMQAKRLKADVIKNNTQPLSLSMDDHEEVSDDYKGIKVYWSSGKNIMKTQQFSFYPNTDEKRYYKLTFHKRYRELMVGDYLNHVLKEGQEIKVRNRLRKLYTNNGAQWSHVVFEHPASFQTLAMDPIKKQEIIDDLSTFTNAEHFYNRIGRAWKRGYLLYGPPGTGKSTMIAAMANFLSYDIYDLELTAVKDNTELSRYHLHFTIPQLQPAPPRHLSLSLSVCKLHHPTPQHLFLPRPAAHSRPPQLTPNTPHEPNHHPIPRSSKLTTILVFILSCLKQPHTTTSSNITLDFTQSCKHQHITPMPLYHSCHGRESPQSQNPFNFDSTYFGSYGV